MNFKKLRLTNRMAPAVWLSVLLAACADTPEQVTSADKAAPTIATPTPKQAATPPLAKPAETGVPAERPSRSGLAEVKPVKQVPQRPSARIQTPSDEVVAVSKLPTKGRRSVVCTTKKEGRATYEVANIHCQNNTDSIQTVLLNIVATGYSRIPTQGNSYLLAVGESKRVARLKVVSRPAEVRLDFRAVPFQTLTPGR